MKKTFEPREIEQHWYAQWERSGYFEPSGQGESYCIMIPPPNVTGTLHMGHAFQDTIMDALIRFQRMRGRNTLWQAGSDHAGIATQMVVERQLNAAGIQRHDIGRDAFIEKIWEWKQHSGNSIATQLRRMGASLDWQHECFTMDESLSEAVAETFVRLYDEGLIYRGKRLVNWDPVLLTAVSDLEVISEEEQGHLWHIRYPTTSGNSAHRHLVVATTRPETLLGDTAVAVHPDDPRYQDLIGTELELPLTGRRIRVIADAHVDPEFGSGCVKITPAHDFNDYEVGKRHGLEQLNIFTDDARINDAAPKAYRGLDRFTARKKIVADLQAQGLMEKIEAHTLKVPRGDRTHSVIEPYLTDQWFVRAQSLAQPAIRAVEDGRIRFVPENWSKTYFEWMRNIEDWCISRQIWWGHRIPAWYDTQGRIYVAHNEAEVRSKYELAPEVELRQDEDVLDTWFSSALWPFSTLGWPDKTERLRTFYPTSVLVTGFDIIFFWVARMIMMGLKFHDEVPFHEVYIHGLVRDADGNKMSKSKGNVLDPLDLIDGIELEALVTKRTTGLMQPALAPTIEAATRKHYPDGIPAYGTDALRFTFCSLATQGRDVRFDLRRIEGYRNFCNKLWNASRYVLMNCEGHDVGVDTGARRDSDSGDSDEQLGTAEHWIITTLQDTEQTVIEAFAAYRFDLAAQALYEFTWNEYCDWYLELSKSVLNDPQAGAARLRGTRRTLIRVLETLLRLSHPVIPFITEAIWQQVKGLAGKQGQSIMLESYPEPDPRKRNPNSVAELHWVKQFILGVRKIRGEMNIRPGLKISVLLQAGSERDYTLAERHQRYLCHLAGIAEIQVQGPNQALPKVAKTLLGKLEIMIPLAGLIDMDAERSRMDKEIARLTLNLDRTQKKLGNESFLSRAPAPVVEKEKQRLDEYQSAIRKLQSQRATLNLDSPG